MLIAGNQAADALRRLDPEDARLWFAVSTVFACLDPPALYYFASIYPQRNRLNRPVYVYVVLALGALFAFASWTMDHPDRPSVWDLFVLAGLVAYTAGVYTIILFATLNALLNEPSRPRMRLLYAALGFAAIPVWSRTLSSVGVTVSTAATGGTSSFVYALLALLPLPVIVAWLLVYASRRVGLARETRRFILRATLAALVLAIVLIAHDLYVGLVGMTSFGYRLAIISHSGASVRWLLFGSLVSMAVLRYEMLGMSLRSRRRAARALVALAFLLAGALLFAALGTLFGSQSLTFSPTDVLFFVALLVASQGFRRVIDRVATAVYGVPMPGDATAAVEAYRLAAVQAARTEGANVSSDLLRLREELGLDDRTGRVIERMAEAATWGPISPGQVVAGRYRVDRLLARGGSGRVFLAVDELLRRDVVLKELLHGDDDGGAQALHEARAAGSLQHPNVVTVYDIHRGPDASLIVTEHVGGGSLADRLDGPVKLSEAEVVEILDEILRGLEAVHARGIVHRDLKPANVLFTHDGRAKIADFGIAWIRQSSTVHAGALQAFQGTPEFMAPEQKRGELAGPSTDLYSVGRMAEACLPKPATPSIQGVVDRALAENPADRWPSAAAMREALHRAWTAPPSAVSEVLMRET